MNSKQRGMGILQGQPVDRVPVFPLLMSFAQQRLGITYREFATDGRFRDLLSKARGLRYMLSPGCEVPADTQDEVFLAFCEAPQQCS